MSAKFSFSLLNVDYVNLNKSWNYRNVMSPFYRMYLITNGYGQLSTPEENIILEEGYMYLIPSFTLFNQSCDELLVQYYVHFAEESATGGSLFASNRKLFRAKVSPTDVLLFERMVAINPGRDLRKSDNPKVYEKSPVIRGFMERNKQLPISVLLESEGIIMQLLSRFMESEEYNIVARGIISPKIPEALNYIATNLSTKLSVEILASRANLSADYFSKLFYVQMGERPLTFIQRKRIERAQFLMVTTTNPLSIIAEETGFIDICYFSRIFKKQTGHTPAAYQRMNEI